MVIADFGQGLGFWEFMGCCAVSLVIVVLLIGWTE